MRDFSLFVADVYEAAGRLRRLSDGVARSVGQSQARWQVLSVISEGLWTVPRIASRLGVTRQNVQRIADELVDERLATYEENEHHRRSPHVVPTRAGIRALQALTAAARDLDAELAQAVGASKLRPAHAALRALLAALRRVERDQFE